MYRIAKMFHFSAAHQLIGLPDRQDDVSGMMVEHPCTRLHGHNYAVELILSRSTLNEHGFVVDYGDLKPFQTYIDTQFDHKNLNDVLTGPTTAEKIARHLYDVAWNLWHDVEITVRVSETLKTWAEFHE